MAKASEASLGDLHGAIAEGLTEVIENGVTLGIGEDGKPIKATASPAFFAAGIAFLKNNNITADPGTNDKLKNLQDKLQNKRQDSKNRLNASDLKTLEELGERELRDMGLPLQ